MRFTTAFLLLLASPLFAQQTLYFNDGIFTVADGRAVPAVADTGAVAGSHSGVEVVSGKEMTFEPAAPRRTLTNTTGTVAIQSPVFRMNRLQLDGSEHTTKGQYGGDTLVSPLLQLHSTSGNIISFCYQRTGRPPGGTYDRTWRDSILTGPEPRVIRDRNRDNVVAEPDRLILEIAGVTTGSLDIPESQWRMHLHPDRSGTYITDNPAFTVFGAGGFRRGFLETFPDSSLSFSDGLRPDIYDDGKDQQYHKVLFIIPSWLPELMEESGTYGVRFRLRVEAADNGNSALPDDADDFYVDNLQLISSPLNRDFDLEITAADVAMPYTMMPERQATAIPITVDMANNYLASGAFTMSVQIEPDIPEVQQQNTYNRVQTIPFFPPVRTARFSMPTFDAFTVNENHAIAGRDSVTYRMRVQIQSTTNDLNHLNDTLSKTFTLYFGDVFAYDPAFPAEGRNDIPHLSGIKGKGLNFEAYGLGNDADETWREKQFGAENASGPGLFAVRFTITTPDTVSGYQAHFGSRRFSDPNYKLPFYFSIRRDQGGMPGNAAATVVEGTLIGDRYIGYDDLRSPEEGGLPVTDEYTTYLLPQPVYLAPGTYWTVIAQRGTEGIELGGSAGRMGLVTTNLSSTMWVGDNNTTLLAEKAFRIQSFDGLVNGAPFAFSNYIGAEVNWRPIARTHGNPAFGYLDYQGTVEGIPTYSRGAIIPMLRPYFGPERIPTDAPEVSELTPARLSVYPNPASVEARCYFSISAAPSYTRLTVLDVFGREVVRPVDNVLEPGSHTAEFSVAELPAGVYFCRLEAQGISITQQFAVVK